jgi:hypothetical protein
MFLSLQSFVGRVYAQSFFKGSHIHTSPSLLQSDTVCVASPSPNTKGSFVGRWRPIAFSKAAGATFLRMTHEGVWFYPSSSSRTFCCFKNSFQLGHIFHADKF